jgi:hypothetical protein
MIFIGSTSGLKSSNDKSTVSFIIVDLTDSIKTRTNLPVVQDLAASAFAGNPNL